MKFLDFGLWYPDADDCAACVFGNEHSVNCLGVQVGNERVYDSGMQGWSESNREAVERAVVR